MNPIVAKEAGDTPEHTERLNRAGGLSLTHIDRFPTKLSKDSGDGLLRRIVVTAYEHRWLTALELWIHHARVADRIESLDKAGAFQTRAVDAPSAIRREW